MGAPPIATSGIFERVWLANTAVFIRLQPTGAGAWNYAKWDPVAAYPFNGNATPGSEERLPFGFWLLLFGAAVAKVRRFISERFDTDDGLADGDPATPRLGRRLYECGSNSIPAGILAIINTVGILRVGGPNPDVTWTQMRAFIRNKLLNQTEEQAGTTIEDLA